MTIDAQPAALLARTSLFQGLPHADMALIASHLRPAHLAPGQLIFSRGDQTRDIYIVAEGRVRLSMLAGDGRELSLIHATPGELFGEVAALDGGPRSADATAIGQVKVFVLPQAELKSLVAKNSRVAQAVIVFLCARLRETNEKLEAIALHPIEVRIARFLMAILRSRGDLNGPVSTIDLAMSQTELAMLVGASRPKVNLALTQLETAGAILRKGTTLICNVSELDRFAAAGG
jgi:CRP/FNR family transcriptional regulator, cyclic AMP receptor protein